MSSSSLSSWLLKLPNVVTASGVRNDPTNYHGICVFSCLGKLFCLILNQRLMEHVNSLKILHNSQIGFLPNNRTADHVFTQRTLNPRLVTCSSVGRVPVCCAGGPGFKPQTGPTLRRMCCLCNYICKWLDIQVFSDKDYKP